jgi:hypothetical protein
MMSIRVRNGSSCLCCHIIVINKHSVYNSIFINQTQCSRHSFLVLATVQFSVAVDRSLHGLGVVLLFHLRDGHPRLGAPRTADAPLGITLKGQVRLDGVTPHMLFTCAIAFPYDGHLNCLARIALCVLGVLLFALVARLLARFGGLTRGLRFFGTLFL